MRILGLDPGLRHTGWGIVDARDNRLTHIACGTISTDAKATTAARLTQLYHAIDDLIADHRPDSAAVEEVFVSKNPSSTLKLGQARGVVIMVPALRAIPVAEYAANLVKKSVVGSGHATKDQIAMMVQTLLPGANPGSADAADALAVAICHAHHANTRSLWVAAS
ncbi:MAG: crossover junction endodeoxyribonuclease RuvC, partial [Pseudomonadota bacterium]